jgi:hypothetical protein
MMKAPLSGVSVKIMALSRGYSQQELPTPARIKAL